MRFHLGGSLMLALMSFVPAFPVAAQEVPTAVVVNAGAEAIPAVAEPAPTPLGVLDVIKKGRALLNEELTRRQAQGIKTVDSQPVWARVTLAVWERDTNAISLVDIRKSGPRVEVLTPGNWPISVGYDNKIYSQYVMPASRNATVIGVVYPVARKLSATKYELHDTLYVPFQEEFYRPEVMAAGSDYLSDVIRSAFDELRDMGIKSRAYPDRLVADVVDPYLLKSIIVIEHTSHRTLLNDEVSERALGVFFAKLAINGDDAFDVALSSAGASGLAQFIPSTYALFVKNRPQYALIPDFAKGMADHTNAVKAEVAYIDDSLAILNGLVKEAYDTDKTKAAEYLAAAYNGGYSRVNRSIASYGEGWTQGLRPETKTYVAKLRRAYSMFQAGMFASRRDSGYAPVTLAAAAATPTVLGATSIYVPGMICFDEGGCRAPS
jgi:hypothetical protein